MIKASSIVRGKKKMIQGMEDAPKAAMRSPRGENNMEEGGRTEEAFVEKLC